MNSRKLTILQIITPRRFSGAERMVVYLSQGLQARGHRVVVACKHNQGLEQELARRKIETHVLPISGKLNLVAPFRLARLARRLGADIIHTHLSTASLWGSFAGKIAHVPVIAEVHALNSKNCFVFADHIVTCSEGVRRHILQQGVKADKVEVLYNGLPPANFQGRRPAAEVRQELGLPLQAPLIGVVAHLSEKKGQRYVIEAMPQLLPRFPNLHCLLVGEGVMRAQLEELAASLGVAEAVRFLGFRNDALDLISAMDAVLLPSIAKEGLGLALIEAGFLHKPVIGSDCPGIDEVIVPGETGLLVPPGDAPALGVAVAHLLDHPEEARRMGEGGFHRASDKFTLEAMAATAESIYRRF